MNRFKQILRAEWQSTRVLVVLMTLCAFAVPLGSVFYGGDVARGGEYAVSNWLSASRTVGQVIPLLSLAAGVLMGMATWAPDHLGRHVYALSLPLHRWQYVLLRFGAGVALLALPVVALGAGAMIAAGSVRLPIGIHAYPLILTMRFALSALVMFAIFFTIAIGTKRAVALTLAVIGGLVLSDVLTTAFGAEPVVLDTVYGWLTHFPGPLAILMGSWALFDV